MAGQGFFDPPLQLKFDDFVKNHQLCFRWLSKNFDIQGVVIFLVRDNTRWYVECLKNCCNAVDRTFYNAIKFNINGFTLPKQQF